MKDKLNDLIPWLEKLLESLAKVNPDGDREEVERRSHLARFVPYLAPLENPGLTPYRSLEDIGTQSLALLEKGKFARVLDKMQDSQVVIRLVEKLRQAVLIYQVSIKDLQSRKSLTRRQVSQQQSIYNQVVQLTVSFLFRSSSSRLSGRAVNSRHPSTYSLNCIR